MDNILAIKKQLVARLRQARKKNSWSQTELSQRAGVSLGSIKRFEGRYEISLTSLIKIAYVLGYTNELQALFSRPNYQSIQEVINDR